MNQSKIKNLFFAFIILLFVGCEGEVGPQGVGLNSLTNVSNEPSGSNCENGGVKIEVGSDNNENGVLDSDEVLSTSYVCNGVDGVASLTVITSEPAGENCQNGGFKIDSGVDSNNDGTLDDDEITATAYVCNGIDGSNTLTKLTTETAGDNCENGGVKIDSGVDNNNDGTLDNDEITATAYVCNGIDGNVSLINITEEANGDNCQYGGIKFESGTDSNGNGALDTEEITLTRYLCHTNFDLEIRFDFDWPFFGSLSTSSTSGSINGTKSTLIDFNISNYVGVDSVAFGAYMFTSNTSTKCIVELYNKSDGTVIANSQVSTNETSETFVTTTINFIDEFPTEKIDLGVRVRSETDGVNVTLTKPLLFLLRE